MSSGKETVFTSDFKGCIDNSTIGGDVTVDIYNKNTNNNSSNSFQPLGDATVAGKTDVTLHGGTWGYVYGIGGNSGSSKEYSDDCRVEFTNVKAINKIEGISYSSITGNATVILTGCETTGFPIRGIYSCNISGDVAVTTEGCSAKDSIYGISNTTVSGNAIISMSNDTCSDVYSIYGLQTAKLGGSATVDIEGCMAYSVYGACETNSLSENCGITISIKDCTATDIYGIKSRTDETITGITDITVVDCTASDTIYGIYYLKCQKDITITTANNQMKNFVGIYCATIEGTATIITDGDNRDVASEGYYYGLQYSIANGDIAVTTRNSQYGNYKAVYNNTACNGSASITIEGCTFSGSYIQPFDASIVNMADGEVDIICRDTAFTSNDSNASISNSLSGGTVTMTMEDSCTINDAYDLFPLYYGGANALLTYQNDYYYAGMYPITADINARNIYFGKITGSKSAYANMMIPEGITVVAEEKLYIPNCCYLLIEGTLNGTVFQGDENYTDGSIYMNGGVMEEEEKMNNRYYPLTLSYLSKGNGTTKFGSGSISTHPLCPNQYFALAGSTPAVTFSAKKGYMLTEVAVTKEGKKPQVLIADDDNNYSFEMEACPAELSVMFTGTQITLDETQSSITTKLYEKTTKDAPLYDLTDIAITNDAEEGDVTYEIKEGSTLPKGLTLEDGKLFGTPAQALEDGKDVVITVTGCNGTTAEFTLHITVMAGDEEGNPVYEVPKDLTAVYGDTLGDVELPSDENGAFTWQQEETTPVGDVGEQEFLVTYTPTNDKYKTVTDIKVTVTVQKAKA
ncbi:MAG: hypothetical protein J6D02_02580, partial [Lachnospira sp.]|nr:hypothetical protein [Lachnospira sp.]